MFTYIPVVNMFVYSFTDWDGLSPDRKFVGVDNYVEIAHPAGAVRGLLRQPATTSAASVVQIVLALYFATILSFNVRFRNLFKGILFFPYLINGVAIGLIFLYFFQPGGTLDSVLRARRRATTQQWLGDPDSRQLLARRDVASGATWA